jgi:PAS domain S-box-containing protein
MPENPTYEDLKRQVAELEARTRELATAQAEYQRSLNFTESLLEAIPTPVFYKDLEGRYKGCNHAFSEIMGVTAEEIRGKTVHELWPSEHAGRYHQMDLELIKSPRLQVYEFEVKDKNGRVRPVVYYKNVYRDENDAVAGLVGAFADISEVRQAQTEQQALLSMSLDMICIADIHTATFLKVNPAFTNTLGYSEEELLAAPFTAFIHPEDIQPTLDVISGDLRKGRKVINFKNRYRCKNGEYRWLNWVSHPDPVEGVTYAVAHDNTEEMRAYEDLRSQRNLLNSLFDNLPTGITLWDDAGALLMINKAFSRLTGYAFADIETLEQWFRRAYPDPLYRRQVVDDWQKMKESSSAAVQELKVACADGGVKDIQFHAAFLEDGRILLSLTDTTEIRRAHSEIRHRQQFLESVLYHAPDAIVTLDERHRIVDWNPGAVKIFGYQPDEAIGHQLDDLVARRQHHREAASKTERMLSGHRIEAFETIRYRKDGSPLHVIVAGSPITVEGELKGVVAVYTDITDRVRSEEAIRSSHHRFLKVLESIDATIYVADMKTYEVLFMNNQMIETFGGNFVGKKCWSVFRGASAPCSICTNHRLVDDSGRPAGVETWQGHNPVTGRWFMNYDRAIEWTDGRVVRLQIAMDITESKKMEEALARAQKMEAIGTLASGIAHDFNNLLMGIQGHSSLIALDLGPSHPHAEHAAAIDQHVKSAANLTRQLLGVVRGGKYEVKAIDIKEVLKTSAAMFGRTHKEIRVRLETRPKPLVVEADRQQIEQVLLNIYVNALQAMPGGGDLSVTALPVDLGEKGCQPFQVAPGNYARISIEDTGIGIEEDIRQKIFDPFFTTKEKSRGTGLGLASAYGIIKNHGGTITVESKVGKGSTFHIYLPLSQKAVKAQGGGTERPIHGNETILLVDDEKMILEVGQAMLERLGYRVITAGGGEKALRELEKRASEVDMVILDLIMPVIDGGETYDRIRQIAPGVPVILSSGYSIDGQAREILNRGCDGFIQKPFDIQSLSVKIRSVLNPL